MAMVVAVVTVVTIAPACNQMSLLAAAVYRAKAMKG